MNKIGTKILIFGFCFWYGLAYLHPNAEGLLLFSETNIVIVLFFFLMLAAYEIGYLWPKGPNPTPNLRPDYIVGSRSFVLVIALVVVFSTILFSSKDRGMLGYHALRAEVAIGILVYIYSHFFKGWKRVVLLLIFASITLYGLSVYSRRPFLTLIAPIFLVPLIRKRPKFGAKLPIGIAITSVSIIGMLYVTGLRSLGPTHSPFDILAIAQKGFSVFLLGQGFDTVDLTGYVLDSYSASNFHYGSTFWGGIVNFIPREVWPGKPIAFGIILSGEYFGVSVDATFTNFGPGIVAEAYANGGYLSILIVAIIFGALVGIFDKKIEIHRYDWNWVLFGCVFYPAIFFMIRGDFLNSFYELYSKACVIAIVVTVTGLRRRLRPANLRRRYHKQH